HDERALVERFLLQLLVLFGALVVVPFQKSSLRLLGQLRNVPGVAPCKRLGRGVVAVVRVAGESFSVGIGVPIVHAPLADIHIVVAGAILGQRLLAVAGDDFDLHAGLCSGLLEGFGNAGDRLTVTLVERNRKTVLQTGLGKQFLRLGDVELVRRSIESAKNALGLIGLADFADALDERRTDCIVIDQIFESFANFRLGQVRVLWVEADVIDCSLGGAGRGKLVVLQDSVVVA